MILFEIYRITKKSDQQKNWSLKKFISKINDRIDKIIDISLGLKKIWFEIYRFDRIIDISSGLKGFDFKSIDLIEL